MRVLCMFCDYLFPGEHRITGGTKHFLEIASAWKRKGAAFNILTTRNGSELCRLYGLGSECRTLRFEGVQQGSAIGILSSFLLRTFEGILLAAKYRGEICIYCSTSFLPDIIPAIAVRFFTRGRSRIVCFVAHLIPHFTVREGTKLTNVLAYLQQRTTLSLIRDASGKILVLNTQLKKELVSMGFQESRLVVIPMGIDLRAIENAKPEPGMNFDACFVGRLHATKGVFDLIEIWNLVNRSRHGARLAILYSEDVHGASTLRQIRARLKEYDLTDSVYIPSVVPSSRVYSILKTSKVFVFPSHEEGWGIAVCEAMAAGLPVVAYDLAPYKEFFAEGLITVKLKDYASFATNVLNLLSDETTRREMGKKAMRIASQYTWDSTADRELLEIKQVCDETQ